MSKNVNAIFVCKHVFIVHLSFRAKVKHLPTDRAAQWHNVQVNSTLPHNYHAQKSLSNLLFFAFTNQLSKRVGSLICLPLRADLTCCSCSRQYVLWLCLCMQSQITSVKSTAVSGHTTSPACMHWMCGCKYLSCSLFCSLLDCCFDLASPLLCASLGCRQSIHLQLQAHPDVNRTWHLICTRL